MACDTGKALERLVATSACRQELAADKLMTENEEIVRLARLQISLDLGANDETTIKSLKRGLGHLQLDEVALFSAAIKLLNGESYALSTDSPQSICRWRSLAKQVGATVRAYKQVDGMTNMVFDPPARN